MTFSGEDRNIADTAAARHPGFRARFLLGVLTAWALLVVVPDLVRVVRPLGSLGFEADNDGVIGNVTGPFAAPDDSPAWQAGIRAGARIDMSAMRCVPIRSPSCADLLTVVGGSGGTQWVRPGRRVRLRIVSPHQAANVVVAARVPRVMWPARAVLLLNEVAAVLLILGGAWLVWTRRGPMTWGFFLYVMWFNPGQFFEFYALLQEHPYALFAQEAARALAQAAGYTGFVLFALYVPRDKTEPPWRPIERGLPLLALLIAGLQLSSLANAFGYGTETVTRLAYLAGYAADALALVILLQRRKGQLPQDYQRLRWVTWGALIGLPAFIFADSNASTTLWRSFWGGFSPPEWLIGLFYLLSGILGYFVFEAVRRPRVINVAIPLTRITILTLLLSAPVFYFHKWFDVLEGAFDRTGWVWVIGGTLFVFLLGRAHEIAVRVADQIFGRARHRVAEELRRAGERLAQASTFDEVEALVAAAATSTLHLASAAVFRREDAGFRRYTDGVGWDRLTATTLDYAHATPAVDGAPKSWALVPGGSDLPGFPSGLQAPVLVVPIADPLRMFALAFYGPHATGADLDAEERALLSEFSRYAAAAYGCVEVALLQQRIASLEGHLAERPGTA